METFPPPYTRRNLQITYFASNNSQQITLFAVLFKESEKSTSSEVLVADMNKLQIGDESLPHLPRLQVHHHPVEGMENISSKKQN